MTENIDGSIIGFFASFSLVETNEELVKSYLWSNMGLKKKLSHLKWKNYGNDLKIILFKIHVNPIPYEKKHLKEIGEYNPNEKSIEMSIILENENFFKLTKKDQEQFFVKSIVNKLEIIELKANTILNFDFSKLVVDVKKSLNYQEVKKTYIKNNFYSSLWRRTKANLLYTLVN